MTNRRSSSQLCPHCKGVTSIPKGKGNRKLTLELVVANHLASCPGVIKVNPQKGKP
jgi:hypothetical protein